MCNQIERHPGPFEGEPCITKLVYDWGLNGDPGDESASLEYDSSGFSFYRGPFTDTVACCDECVHDLAQAKNVAVEWDSQGFITSSLDVPEERIAEVQRGSYERVQRTRQLSNVGS